MTEYLYCFGFHDLVDAASFEAGFDDESSGAFRVLANSEEEALAWGHVLSAWFVALLSEGGTELRWTDADFANWIDRSPDEAMQEFAEQMPLVKVGEYPDAAQALAAHGRAAKP